MKRLEFDDQPELEPEEEPGDIFQQAIEIFAAAEAKLDPEIRVTFGPNLWFLLFVKLEDRTHLMYRYRGGLVIQDDTITQQAERDGVYAVLWDKFNQLEGGDYYQAYLNASDLVILGELLIELFLKETGNEVESLTPQLKSRLTSAFFEFAKMCENFPHLGGVVTGELAAMREEVKQYLFRLWGRP